MNTDRSPFALTPWVRRILMLTGAVYLLHVTVFYGGALEEFLGLRPTEVLHRPWSVLTYALLHGSFLHILVNMLALFMFGPPLEHRLGGRTFLRLYVISALGGAALSLLMLPLTGDALIIGASAAVYGVMMGFVLEWPDAPVLIFPLPVPVKAKWIVIAIAAFSLYAGYAHVQQGVAHFAHLGGFAAAFIYLRAGSVIARPKPARTAERSPAVLVRPPAAESGRRAEYSAPPQRRSAEQAVRAEVDRVLDKISENGLDSLTPDERRFLDEMSKRFQQDH
ncbi:MAG: rhomboid family intramembrane serine protease [Gemmatimonadales bacterium]